MADGNKKFLSQVGLETYHAKLQTKFQTLQNEFTSQIAGLGNVLHFSSTELADDAAREALNLTESDKGTVYFVTSTGKEWLWTGTKWIDLGTPYDNVLKNKVDKVAGKELSTNDYTDEEKSKLQGLSNYDDTIIKNELANKVDKIDGKELSTNDYTDEDKAEVSTIKNKVTKEAGKGLSTNDYTDEEKSKLQGLSNYDDTIIKNNLNNKVTKETGKGLSSNDLTDELKDKIEIQPTPLKNATHAEDLYKIMVDQFGRITKAVKVTDDEISEKINAISSEDINALLF